jgi:hypothetical protein
MYLQHFMLIFQTESGFSKKRCSDVQDWGHVCRCPSIEAIIANMLIRAGEIPNPTDGLKKKAQWLEQHGIIPPDVSSALEMLATVRNKILHGNFSPPDEEIFVFPLCRLVFPYLRRLLSEHHPASANSQ